MLVEKLEIDGFRGIQSLRLALDPKLTVLVGENGVGKTSILDAIAILLDNYVARWLRGSAQSAERLRDADIKIGCHTARISISVKSSDGLQGAWTVRRQDRIGKLREPTASDFLSLNAMIRSQITSDIEHVGAAPLMIY
jgi:predicted ATP-dependent endonuclease of OLD family